MSPSPALARTVLTCCSLLQKMSVYYMKMNFHMKKVENAIVTSY